VKLAQLLVPLFAALAPTAALAQTVDRFDPILAEHARARYAERVEELFAALDAASAARRERAAAELGQGRAAALAWPDFEAIGRATRATQEVAENAPRELSSEVDGIDLMVVPGAFDAHAASGAGPPLTLTVRVWMPPGAPRPTQDGELVLILGGADGVEREVRRAKVTAAAFAAPGFELFVRAPSGPPGMWSLTPKWRRAGATVRGHAVEVEGVVGPLAKTPTGIDAARAHLYGELEQLVDHGIRAAHGVPPSAAAAWLAADTAVGDQGLPAIPLPWFAVSLPAAGTAPDGWRRGFDGEARGLVVAVAPPQEGPAAVLRGSRGRDWAEFLDTRGFDLISIPADDTRALERSLGALFEEAALRQLPIHVVARASSGLAVQLVWARARQRGGAAPLAVSLALALPGLPQQSPAGLGTRSLVVAPVAAFNSKGVTAGEVRAYATAPAHAVPLLDDREWPARLAVFLDSAAFVRGDG